MGKESYKDEGIPKYICKWSNCTGTCDIDTVVRKLEVNKENIIRCI